MSKPTKVIGGATAIFAWAHSFTTSLESVAVLNAIDKPAPSNSRSFRMGERVDSNRPFPYVSLRKTIAFGETVQNEG
jgi:hypothetical protein